MKLGPHFWSSVTMSYLLVALAAVLTAYLVVYKQVDGEALGLVIGVWLREGMGTVFQLMQYKGTREDKD